MKMPELRGRMGNNGRPPKPRMTDAEYAHVLALSTRDAALQISHMRGAFTQDSALTAKDRAWLTVSEHWVRAQRRKRDETHFATKGTAGTWRPLTHAVRQNPEARAIRDPEWHKEEAEETGESTGVRKPSETATNSDLEVAAGGNA